jgi:hypothetical protein
MRSRLVALCLAVAACSPTASASPASSAATAPPPPTSAGSVPSPSSPAPLPTTTARSNPYDVAGTDWESQFVFMEPHGLGRIKGLVAGGLGFMMWSDEAEGRPGFLWSRDRESWVQVDATVTGRSMLTLTAGRDEFLGLASTGEAGIELWRSRDGTTWATTAAIGIDGTPSAMVVTPSGYAAAGRDASGCGFAAWTSPDAVRWTSSGPLPVALGSCTVGAKAPNIDQLLSRQGALLALGVLADGTSAIWTSTDGHSWAQAISVAGHFAGVTEGGPGYVAVGDDGGTPATAAVWTSPDGRTWTAVPPDVSFAGATMSNVVTLADRRLVAVGLEPRLTGGPRLAAWISSDGQVWERTPAAVCPNVEVCDASGVQGPFLATDGQRLAAYDGSINILVSPPVTAGIRPATLTLGFDHPPAGTWASGVANGFCASATDPGEAIQFGAAYPRLLDVGAAWGSASYVPSVWIEVGPDGSVMSVNYDRGDDAGFTGLATDAGPGEFLIGPDHITVDAGSTSLRGQVEFRDLPVNRSDTALPPVQPVSGTLRWNCG